MSATPPTGLEGTHAPTPVELLWERYRSLVLTVVIAALAAIGLHYGWKRYDRAQTDEKWTAFAVNLGLRDVYTDSEGGFPTLTQELKDVPLTQLEQAAQTTDKAQRPYYLIALARKAMLEQQWEKAEAALQALETQFPKHTLVTATDLPVQVREPIPDDDKKPQGGAKQLEWKPAKAGSAVTMMREQIAAAREFAPPAHFAKPEIPEDAPRVKFEFGEYGSAVVALMPQAEKHVAAFLELANNGHWEGMAVDEVQRKGRFKQPRALHLGYESTKNEDDRSKWTTTEPSKNPVEWEKTGLGHFAGALSARTEADNKSAADRFWIMVDDAPQFDGQRVVFGYVVEGLDTIQQLIESAGLSAQDEEMGRGRPTENIRVTDVTVL